VVVCILAGLSLAFACRSSSPTSPEPAPSARPKTSGAPLEPEPESSTTVLGPPAPAAAREAHEHAVVALLRGLSGAQHLPEVATDDGGAVDPRLRDVLAPKQTIVVERPPPRPTGLGDL
jgi:hypothetical protein